LSTTGDALSAPQACNTYYGASHILRGIDFTVARGETIGLMGRNGMGKSTLLKSLMGLVKPRGGTVHIMGKPMTGRAPFEIAQLGIAYVPEGRGIFGNLSVVENLKMAARAGTDATARARAGLDLRARAGDLPAPEGAPGPRRPAAQRRRAADADHRPRADDQPRRADPGRSHRRPGAADRTRDLAHLQPDPRIRHQQRHRGQELETRHPDHRPQRDPGQGRGGVSRGLQTN
jgi:ABC-type sugar transport system ATPase subunit